MGKIWGKSWDCTTLYHVVFRVIGNIWSSTVRIIKLVHHAGRHEFMRTDYFIGVTEPSGQRYNVHAPGNLQAGVCVPKLVEREFRQAALLNKFAKPYGRVAGEYRLHNEITVKVLHIKIGADFCAVSRYTDFPSRNRANTCLSNPISSLNFLWLILATSSKNDSFAIYKTSMRTPVSHRLLKNIVKWCGWIRAVIKCPRQEVPANQGAYGNELA